MSALMKLNSVFLFLLLFFVRLKNDVCLIHGYQMFCPHHSRSPHVTLPSYLSTVLYSVTLGMPNKNKGSVHTNLFSHLISTILSPVNSFHHATLNIQSTKGSDETSKLHFSLFCAGASLNPIWLNCQWGYHESMNPNVHQHPSALIQCR